MCAGLATLFGPPTLGGACYMLWCAGGDAAHRSMKSRSRPPSSFMSIGSGLAALAAAYKAQSAVLVRHFDEGGALSLDWKKGTDSLGEPLKINTWRQFYRACGPPVIARTGALLVSVYIAGGASAFVARRLYPEPPLPRSEAKKKRA